MALNLRDRETKLLLITVTQSALAAIALAGASAAVLMSRKNLDQAAKAGATQRSPSMPGAAGGAGSSGTLPGSSDDKWVGQLVGLILIFVLLVVLFAWLTGGGPDPEGYTGPTTQDTGAILGAVLSLASVVVMVAIRIRNRKLNEPAIADALGFVGTGVGLGVTIAPAWAAIIQILTATPAAS